MCVFSFDVPAARVGPKYPELMCGMRVRILQLHFSPFCPVRVRSRFGVRLKVNRNMRRTQHVTSSTVRRSTQTLACVKGFATGRTPSHPCSTHSGRGHSTRGTTRESAHTSMIIVEQTSTQSVRREALRGSPLKISPLSHEHANSE